MKVHLIGIGGGHPDQITLQAVAAIADVDVFLVADKGSSTGDLAAARQEILKRHGGVGHRVVAVADPQRDRQPEKYERAVLDWHDARARAYAEVLESLDPGTIVGFLVWGDPSLYDSTIRVLEKIRDLGTVEVDFDVIPGISSVAALAASFRLVLNRIGGPITITTGRALVDDVARGLDNLVVMLDGNLACRALVGMGWAVHWGANLGTAGEKLVSGELDAVIGEIEQARADAKAEHGWVMDVYLLRRT